MNKYYNKLEIDQIIFQLIDHAIIPTTKKIIENLTPLKNIDDIRPILVNVDEALSIVRRLERAPIMISSDLFTIVKTATLGGILTPPELYELVRLFHTVKALQKHIGRLIKENISAENYISLVNKLILLDNVFNSINNAIDESGVVLDSASSILKNIRSKIKNIDSRMKSRLQEIVTKEASKLSQATIVIRNDCYCLPVKAEYKNQIKGTVQDMSSSLQTIYIEPAIINELNLQKDQLQNEEKNEINRILKELTRLVEVNSDILIDNFNTIIEIDLLFAKAVLALSYDGAAPNINKEGRLNLVNARHPLLKVNKVIPNNVSFGNNIGIIITGPNTGGKTVLLKTVGLLALMVKYGLLIPAESTSDMMIYDDIYCDIGDDQSIQNNLSTFSSHMINIVDIINQANPRSLVLFDELGAGTDPSEGSNLAIAILKYLLNNNISFITTTHYSSLKAFGFEEKQVVNASMEFDQNTLSPTYRLLIGVSGSSNAFNIAKRLGLKTEIIDDALTLMINSDDDVKRLINRLESKLEELKELENNNILLQQEYNMKLKQLEIQITDNEKNRSRIIKEAHKEAEKLLLDMRSEADRILDDLAKANKDQIKMHEIIEFKRRLDIELPSTEKEISPNTANVNIEVGMDVYIPRYDQYGTITKKLKNKIYEVMIGNMRMKIDATDIKTQPSMHKQSDSGLINSISNRSSIKLSLDLRGCRYEEAKDLIEKYIDDLLCANIKQATIIHGYGTGVIRELVQKFLKNNPHIASYRYGGEGEGGLGVTVITLK